MSVTTSVGLSSLVIAKKLHLEPAQHQVKIERKVSFETSDGTRLSADLFHPADLKKSPTILVRIPFSETPETSFLVENIGRLWAERGFTAVIQGTRGRFKSGGEFYPMTFERKDGIETLSWLAKQPWYNGEIGGWGGSAYGQTLWSIADQTAPPINSMEVYFTSTDFRKMFYTGNAFSLYTALGWAFRSHDKHRDEDGWPSTERIVRAANRWPMKDADKSDLGHEVDFFQDWVRHKNDDDYWKQVDGSNQNCKFHGPVLFLAGWFDPFLTTELIDFHNVCKTDKSQKTRIVIGPWSHARDVDLPNFQSSDNFRPKSVALSLPWFKETLTKQSTLSKPQQRISIFVMGVNKWRNENEWPLARTKYTAMFLQSGGHANGSTSDGMLTLVAPAAESSENRYIYDPNKPVPTTGGAMIGHAAGMYLQNEVEKRSDVLNYTTDSLTEDIEVTGPVKVTLYVATDAPCTDFTAKLVDVYPNGKAYNLCNGILRRHYSSLNADKSDKAVPTKIEIDLGATSNVFRKGHSVRLEISSSDFPRFDRNPNTGGDPAIENNPRTAHQQMFSGSKFPSRIILPIVPNAI